VKITVITLTGDRPEAFALCQRWMNSQTRKPDQWIVVDDGQTPMVPVLDCGYIRREPRADDPKHTMIMNMKEAVKHIQGAYILIMEDDEYYAPGYIAALADTLSRHEVAGIGRSKYYHLPTGGYLRHNNLGHASLAQMGFRASFLPEFLSVLDGDQFLDIRLWKLLNGESAPVCDADDLTEMSRITKDKRGIIFDDGETNCLYVGMKGLPGRPGIGSGHGAHKFYNPDSETSMVLKKWIGDETAFESYMRLTP